MSHPDLPFGLRQASTPRCGRRSAADHGVVDGYPCGTAWPVATGCLDDMRVSGPPGRLLPARQLRPAPLRMDRRWQTTARGPARRRW